MTPAELAIDLNTTETEAASFLSCLKIWTDKGYTVEQALSANLRTWDNIARAFTSRPNSEEVYAFTQLCADAVWEHVHQTGA